jgi:hypothetical protein
MYDDSSSSIYDSIVVSVNGSISSMYKTNVMVKRLVDGTMMVQVYVDERTLHMRTEEMNEWT